MHVDYEGSHHLSLSLSGKGVRSQSLENKQQARASERAAGPQGEQHIVMPWMTPTARSLNARETKPCDGPEPSLSPSRGRAESSTDGAELVPCLDPARRGGRLLETTSPGRRDGRGDCSFLPTDFLRPDSGQRRSSLSLSGL